MGEKKSIGLRLVAVHLGVRRSAHSEESLKIAKDICEKVMLKCNSFNSEQAVVELVRLMEDDQRLNCGYGSNLNIDGVVECDASLMSDRTETWTGVGAVSSCKNPILLAKAIRDKSTISRPLGLIQPCLMVGSGATKWMQKNCPSLSIHGSKLISNKSLNTYQRVKSKYDRAVKQDLSESVISSGPSSQNTMETIDQMMDIELDVKETEEVALDTVGAIAVDCDGNFASAISSGGLMLKYKGRVGHAAVAGAGCWAQGSIAVTTTGVGEYLIQNLFAKKVHDRLETNLNSCQSKYPDSPIDNFNDELKKCFLDLHRSIALKNVKPNERLAGMLVAFFSPRAQSSPGSLDERDLFLAFGMNAPSLCIGYMSNNDTSGHSRLCVQANSDSYTNTIRII